MAVNQTTTNSNFVYNVNNTATQVLAAKQVKENLFVKLLHRNGKGVTEKTETNASSIRMFKIIPGGSKARELGHSNNGAFFNSAKAKISQVKEYDLNLLYLMDEVYDIPEVQQDMVSVNIFDETTKNIGGECATAINASTIAHQLKAVFKSAATATKWDGLAVKLASTPKYQESFIEANTILDEGDPANHIQSFPFEDRQALITSDMRRGLMSNGQILLGGSNFAQSMLAKGTLSPEDNKDFGNMYLGEIDGVPVYFMPKAILDAAKEWAGGSEEIAKVKGMICAASATDRGISTQDYIKITDSPDGAGKRLQPKTRWGINVCYSKGIVPILANNISTPAELTITAPGNISVEG
jgi:hypothetical protein